MSDHSDVSYLSEGDGYQHGQQQRGPLTGGQQGFRAAGARLAKLSHTLSLGSSGGVEEFGQDPTAAASWQVRVCGHIGICVSVTCRPRQSVHGYVLAQAMHQDLQGDSAFTWE
jgi:hypothetical protein